MKAVGTNLGAILVLNLKLVLQHDHVPLSLLVLHLGLERRAEGVQEVATGGDGGVGEETDPSESRDDALLLGGGGEDGEGGNASEECPGSKSSVGDGGRGWTELTSRKSRSLRGPWP